MSEAVCSGSVPNDAERVRRHVIKNNGINMGNRVFATAVERYLTKDDIELTICPIFQLDPKSVSEEYDYVVSPYANIFRIDFNDYLERWANWINQLTIPFFVIGCGVQCQTYSQLNELKKKIGDKTAFFVSAVEKTGGGIATRGYITKEFLDLCCDNNAVATGCPAFYMRGSTHRLEKKDLNKDEFSVAFTSFDYPEKWLKREMSLYQNSIIVDQALFFSSKYLTSNVIELLDRLTLYYGKGYVKALLDGKIYAPADIECWANGLSNCSYAYGSRIHGSIMSLYAGVPVKLVCVDLRTKELADYIGMPSADYYDKNLDLFEDYCRLDLDKFNARYQEGYNTFKHFMESNGITHDLDDDEAWKKKISKIQFRDIPMFTADEEKECIRYFNSVQYNIKSTKSIRTFTKACNKVKRTLKIHG
jgi:hypothetical protein